MLRTPGTSLQITTEDAPIVEAIHAAVQSDPLLESVDNTLSESIPYHPAHNGIISLGR